MNTLVNLAKQLYVMQSKYLELEQKNDILETQLQENEDNIIFAMLACTELYEMMINVTIEVNYGKGRVATMSSAMVKVYTNLIKRGLKTLDEVPEKLRAEVEAEL